MSLSLCKNHSYAVLSEFSREAIVPVRHLLLLANIVTTSKAPVTSSVAPVTTSKQNPREEAIASRLNSPAFAVANWRSEPDVEPQRLPPPGLICTHLQWFLSFAPFGFLSRSAPVPQVGL